MQSELIFTNLGALLDEAGLSRNDILHLRTFVTAREHFPEYMTARDIFLDGVAVKPVCTVVICIVSLPLLGNHTFLTDFRDTFEFGVVLRNFKVVWFCCRFFRTGIHISGGRWFHQPCTYC